MPGPGSVQPKAGFFCFFVLVATPVVYGSSWVRGQIGAAAEAYTKATATLDLSLMCTLCCSLCLYQIPNPLSKTSDLTRALMDTSHR